MTLSHAFTLRKIIKEIQQILEHDRELMQQLGELLAKLAPKDGDSLAQQGVAQFAYSEALKEVQNRVNELTTALHMRDANLEAINQIQGQIDKKHSRIWTRGK